MHKYIALIVLTLLPRYSAAFELGMPLLCDYGTECFIQNYVDKTPGKETQDYHSGHLTYDGHDGTDFRLRNILAMQHAVAVVAAAPGTVKAVRDGMQDINVNIIGKAAIMRHGCGNAVVLQHEQSYNTLYCHMKKGSVAVKKGDRVEKGQKLGEVGLSGLTEFPHLHFGVIYQGKKLDPFTGGTEQHPLWDQKTASTLRYIPTGLLNATFGSTTPKSGEITGETLSQSSREMPAIILSTEIFGVQPDDTVTLAIRTPEGSTLVEKTTSISHNKAVLLYYIGKKRSKEVWPEGTYTGLITLKRRGDSIIEKKITLAIGG